MIRMNVNEIIVNKSLWKLRRSSIEIKGSFYGSNVSDDVEKEKYINKKMITKDKVMTIIFYSLEGQKQTEYDQDGCLKMSGNMIHDINNEKLTIEISAEVDAMTWSQLESNLGKRVVEFEIQRLDTGLISKSENSEQVKVEVGLGGYKVSI